MFGVKGASRGREGNREDARARERGESEGAVLLIHQRAEGNEKVEREQRRPRPGRYRRGEEDDREGFSPRPLPFPFSCR